MEGGGVAALGEARTAAAPGLAAFSAFGVELEYMIVDRVSLDVRRIADRVLQRLHGASGHPVSEVERGPVGWSNELVLHLLELKNPRPTRDLASLASHFQAELRAVRSVLGEFGARLMPGGMHPWMDAGAETSLWPHEGSPVYRAYDAIFDCRRHGWANVQAMHVNLPFADDAEFERLHAAVRVLLPLVPGIAASSPFADGRSAGALDYRMEVYRTNSDRVPALAGMVVPHNYSSRAQYESRLLEPMYRAMGRHDPGRLLRHEWLNAHGAIARFERNAIEIRVADVQEHAGADIAVAALLVDAAWWLFAGGGPSLAAQQALDTASLAGVLRACARDGERARIEDAALLRLFRVPGPACAAADLWGAVAKDLERAGAPHRELWRPRLERTLAQGTLARRLLAAAGSVPDRAALASVYARLCDCLDDGRDFEP